MENSTRKRNCDNCCYGTYILNELGENLYCDINPYAMYAKMVTPDYCCEEHIFMDDNFNKDIDDEAYREHIKECQKRLIKKDQ